MSPNFIYRYKHWLFEILIETKAEKEIKLKDKLSAKSYKLYQCYVDLSELLFPGSKYEYVTNNK